MPLPQRTHLQRADKRGPEPMRLGHVANVDDQMIETERGDGAEGRVPVVNRCVGYGALPETVVAANLWKHTLPGRESSGNNSLRLMALGGVPPPRLLAVMHWQAPRAPRAAAPATSD